MENKMKRLTNRLSMSILLLLIVITFSKCKKDTADFTPQSELTATTENASSISAAAVLTPKPLDVTKARKESGFAYKMEVDLGTSTTAVRIFENGVELGEANAVHETIRKTGKGKFSYRPPSLYFSSSDNSDPKTNGRKYTYVVGAGTVGTQAGVPTVGNTTPVPSSSASDIIGYAMVGGKTTGGQGGATVNVSTLAALKSAVESTSPLIIYVSGTITGTGFLRIKSNKTILGKKGSSLQGVGLLVYGQNNVIIRNMTIKNVVQYSNVVVKEGAHHVWVDHCDLSSDRDHGWDYYDGLLDVGNKANYVTLSWNKLYDNHKAMLIGFADTKNDDKDYLKVTVHSNYFYNVSERQPSSRFGYTHAFNNYMVNGSYGIGSRMGGTVRADNNYFENVSTPFKTDFNSTPGFISGVSTNIVKGGGSNKITSKESSWVPTYEYKSAMLPAASVPTAVKAGAGATLNL